MVLVSLQIKNFDTKGKSVKIATAIVMALGVVAFVGGCAQNTYKSDLFPNGIPSGPIELPSGGPERVNANWSVNCTADEVKAIERCFVGTRGDGVTSSGEVFSNDDAPFQIVYLNERGPLLEVGYNDYPGKRPTIRVDGGPVVQVPAGPVPDQIIESLLNGKTVLASYYVWPSGREDMSVDLSGIREAVDALDSRRKKQ